jgi:hypothetical protein
VDDIDFGSNVYDQVAPVYKNHIESDGSQWRELESTATDVMLVHKMLGANLGL